MNIKFMLVDAVIAFYISGVTLDSDLHNNYSRRVSSALQDLFFEMDVQYV